MKRTPSSDRQIHPAAIAKIAATAALALLVSSACSSSKSSSTSSSGTSSAAVASTSASNSSAASTAANSPGSSVAASGSPQASVAPAAKHYHLALITGDNHDPFFVSMNAGAQAEAKALGVSVNWQGPAQYQASLQIPIVSAVLTSKPDFVFICPTDAQALGAPIKQLTSAGIPVMTLDSDINDTSARLGNITSNNLLGGQQAADNLANLLGGKGEVAVLNEQPGVSTTDLRQKGFEQELAAKFPGIKYLGVGRDNDDTTTATTTASALLSRNPGLTGFFATDTANGAGAATAVQQAGRPVKVVAFDAEPEEVTALKLGHISALIVQKAYDFGQLAVEDAVGYLNGNHAAIPPSTLETYVIATAQNVNSPEVQKYLYIQK
jgi:ribose transport system substrate-binding protein